MLPEFIGDSEFEKLDFLRISAWTKHAYEGKVRVSAKPPVAALLANNGEISLPVISGLFRYRRRVASPSSDLRKTVIHEPRVSALLFANITTLRKRASFQLPTIPAWSYQKAISSKSLRLSIVKLIIRASAEASLRGSYRR